MWLAKPEIFTIWSFTRKRLLALGPGAGDTTMNKTHKKCLLSGSLNSLYTSILYRIGIHLCYHYNTYIYI